MAKGLVPAITGEDHDIITPLETVKGKDLEGIEYEPLYSFAQPREKAWYVVSDHYVTLSDGTGIVHIAPAFGEDDARLGREYQLPFVQLVNTEGNFVEGTDYAGMYIKDVDPLILEDRAPWAAAKKGIVSITTPLLALRNALIYRYAVGLVHPHDAGQG